MTYQIFIDDNFHYMDESERTGGKVFDTYEEAVIACKKIVDQCLVDSNPRNLNADDMYSNYCSFGDDPFILPSESEENRFSAWSYAKQRCLEICASNESE